MLVKRCQQRVQLAQRLLGNERLPTEGEKRAARRLGHPGGQALPILGCLDEQLTFPPFGIALNGAHFLVEKWVEGIYDLDSAQVAGTGLYDARIAGIIRQRL